MPRSPKTDFRGYEGLRRRGFNSYELCVGDRIVSIARYGRARKRWRVVFDKTQGLAKTPNLFSTLGDAARAARMALTGFL